MTGQSTDFDAAARLMRLATYASVATATVLAILKLVAWVMTDSVSLLSTLIDSLLDVAASLVTLFAIRQALTPADNEHRFGHGKAEPLASLGQAAFIAGSSLLLFVQAVPRLFSPQALEKPVIGFGVMGFSIVATFVLTRFQAMVSRKTGSLAIKADSAHYLSDLLVNVSVIVAFVLSSELGWYLADPICALLVAFYILWTAWTIARGSLDMLMDRELPDEERQRIRAFVLAQPEVRGVHDLRTRASGPHRFVQMHLELDPQISLERAHRIADALERRLEAEFGVEVLVHQDLHDPAKGRRGPLHRRQQQGTGAGG
jgi:ferrous-iron efflux pump FieF